MNSTFIQNKTLKARQVLEKYKKYCPECGTSLVFSEASFYCPICGFSQEDFVLELS